MLYQHWNRRDETGGISIGFIALDQRLGEIEDNENAEMYDKNALLIVQAIADLAEEIFALRRGDEKVIL